MSTETILALLFGWLLGLFSPAISQRIHGAPRKAELRLAILTELDELGYKMALVSHALRFQLDLLTDDHILWLEGKMARYKGPENATGVLLLLAELKKHPPSRRYPQDHAEGSFGLIEHTLPLLELHRLEIVGLPLAFQSAVLRILSQLEIFNQRVAITREQQSGSNSENRGEAYRELADQSRLISDLIDEIPH